MSDLFQLGDFRLHSGGKSDFKIECDTISDGDWQVLAVLVARMVGPYGTVQGIPGGGLKLATVLRRYADTSLSFMPLPHLLVDDVLTTAGSMESMRAALISDAGRTASGAAVVGAVVFARGQCPGWIKAVFQMPECLWSM